MAARSEGLVLQEPLAELRTRKLRSATKVTSQPVIEASNHITKQNGRSSRLSLPKSEMDMNSTQSPSKFGQKTEEQDYQSKTSPDDFLATVTQRDDKDLAKCKEENATDQGDSLSDETLEVTQSPKKSEEISDSHESGDDDLDDENEDSAEEDLGDPSREPGEDAVREIEADHLLPFRHGWKREVIVRKGSGQTVTQYEVSYFPPESGQFRTREAKRKRTSKTDQERYFSDFPSAVLSIKNFSYVRRPLGINNSAYEIVKKGEPLEKEENLAAVGALRGGSKPGSLPSRHKPRQVSSYKEMDEMSDQLFYDSDSQVEDEEVSVINGFEMSSSITDQVFNYSIGLRAENKKYHVRRDPSTCCTPPVAEDTPWTVLYDDPLGIFNELGGRSSPTTPPPLRAVNLTPASTSQVIKEKFLEKKEIAKKFDVLQPQPLYENSASHDVAIHRGGMFAQTTSFHGHLTTFTTLKRTHNPFLKYSSSLIMKPVFNQLKQPTNSWTANNLRSCSLKCPMAGGTIPDVQCITCQRFYHAYCQGVSQQTTRMFKCRMCLMGIQDHVGSSSKETIRLKLPMQLIDKDRKRPIVELVMFQNGKYQPIKFSNNVQVTEVIPKSMFDQANALRRPVYQKSSQVPKVGTNAIFVAVNPTNNQAGTSHQIFPTNLEDQRRSDQPFKPQGNSQQPSPSEQVSILVKPQGGGKPVLLNVPRRIAVKVKAGTTLSFSANEEKYTVLSTRIHPPVAKKVSVTPSQSQSRPTQSNQISQTSLPAPGSTSLTLSKLGITRLPSSSVTITPAQPKPSVMPRSLPPSVSLEPVSRNSNNLPNRKRPAVSVFINRASESTAKLQKFELPKNVLSSGEIVSQSLGSSLTPCTPYCPGVSGPPELECSGCQSLFHTKCAGIPQNAVQKLKLAYKCKVCLQRRVSTPSGPVQVIELD